MITEPGSLLIQALRDHLKAAQSLVREPGQRKKLVHQVRTGVKRPRATWRLPRPSFPDTLFRRENGQLRKVARSLTAAREREVIVKTLEKLRDDARSKKEFGRFANAAGDFRVRSRTEREDGKKSWRQALQVFSDSLGRLEALDLQGWDWNRVRPALSQSYRKARKAYRKTDLERDVSFHEWRKRTKDLWYPLEALTPNLPGTEKVKQGLERLQDKLGRAHDLAVLEERMPRGPGDFGGEKALAENKTDLGNLPIGMRLPKRVEAVVEIPRDSRIKYEYDVGSGLFRVGRVLSGAMCYPVYGFIPSTLAADGDCLDILRHFFAHYKELEGKPVQVERWTSREEACSIVEAAHHRCLESRSE